MAGRGGRWLVVWALGYGVTITSGCCPAGWARPAAEHAGPTGWTCWFPSWCSAVPWPRWRRRARADAAGRRRLRRSPPELALPPRRGFREERQALGHREFKRRLVEAGRTHAALVFDGDVAVAWAQFGTVPDLPNIDHRKDWEKGVTRIPDYRITCLFVDRTHRRDGMAAVAVRGAPALIAEAGGGLVEAYPHDLPAGKKTSASFLYNATRTMYERLGFDYERPKTRRSGCCGSG